MALLAVERLTRRFGGLVALDEVTLSIERGETVGLIGPNGAGKTTLFNCVTGLLRPSSGEIRFGAESPEALTRMAPHAIVARGIARTFQNIRLFSGMSALENVMIGAHCRARTNLLGASLRTAASRREEDRLRGQAAALLSEVGLAGAVFAAKQGTITPDSFDFILSVMVLAMVVLGGLGSIRGAVIGALLLGSLPELLRGFDQYRMVAFGLSMIIIMRLRPQGLFGRRAAFGSR